MQNTKQYLEEAQQFLEWNNENEGPFQRLQVLRDMAQIEQLVRQADLLEEVVHQMGRGR